MWLTHFWHSWSQFFIFAWDVTAGGILRTGVLICLVIPILLWKFHQKNLPIHKMTSTSPRASELTHGELLIHQKRDKTGPYVYFVISTVIVVIYMACLPSYLNCFVLVHLKVNDVTLLVYILFSQRLKQLRLRRLSSSPYWGASFTNKAHRLNWPWFYGKGK